MKNIQMPQKVLAVLLALGAVFQTRAESFCEEEKIESGTLSEMRELPLEKTLENENLMAEIEKILEETVDEALLAQKESLLEDFDRKSGKVLKSRSFWRKTALCELWLVVCTVFAGFCRK